MDKYFTQKFYENVTVESYLIMANLMPEIVDDTFMEDVFPEMINSRRSDLIIALLENELISLTNKCPDVINIDKPNRLEPQRFCDDFIQILKYLKQHEYAFSLTDNFTLSIFQICLQTTSVPLLEFFISNTKVNDIAFNAILFMSSRARFVTEYVSLEMIKIMTQYPIFKQIIIHIIQTYLDKYGREEIDEFLTILTPDEINVIVKALIRKGVPRYVNSILSICTKIKLDDANISSFIASSIHNIDEEALVDTFSSQLVDGSSIVIEGDILQRLLTHKPHYDFSFVEDKLGIRFDWDSLTSKHIVALLDCDNTNTNINNLSLIVDVLMEKNVNVIGLLREYQFREIVLLSEIVKCLIQVGLSEEEAMMFGQKIYING